MIKKLGIVGAVFPFLFCVVADANPATILKNTEGHAVYFYELPQKADENGFDSLITEELNDMAKKGVGQLLVDDVSSTLLAKINSGFAKLCGKQPWDGYGIPVNYIDVRVTERIALLIRTVALLNTVDYLDGADLAQIYQQWGFSADQAKKLKETYQNKFAPWCQKMRQMIAKISNPPSQQEAEQLGAVAKKFEQCFIDHFFIIFGSTRKALAAEHNALLQEIASYKDGKVLEPEYNKICGLFKQSAPWLTDTTAEETFSTYLRRCVLLSDDEKQALELFRQKDPSQAPALDDINLLKIVSDCSPLIAIRGVHAIVNCQKPVALFILDADTQDIIIALLQKAGYAEVKQ